MMSELGSTSSGQGAARATRFQAMQQVAILGAGGMGTALALLIARSSAAVNVRLWCRDPDYAGQMARGRVNVRHLPEAVLPDAIEITHQSAFALRDADLIVAAIPSSYLRETLTGVAADVPADAPVLSVVKGIEYGTFARPSQIITQTLGSRPVSVMSGPSHAEELARGLPASVVVSGASDDLNDRIRDLLSHQTFRVYTSPDALGVELAGALKNILGIAAGICDGLGFGDNAKAALLTRGLVEIARLGVELGGKCETFYGLAGVGDMVTTCYSPYGRNRSLGERIGRGETLERILAGMVNVAEGVPTTRSVHSFARERRVEMPITTELYRVLFEKKQPHSAVVDLMVRVPKVEWES
jgi:glycerol-3-phosphate dehydrogenase (NAD(P)+)